MATGTVTLTLTVWEKVVRRGADLTLLFERRHRKYGHSHRYRGGRGLNWTDRPSFKPRKDGQYVVSRTADRRSMVDLIASAALGPRASARRRSLVVPFSTYGALKRGPLNDVCMDGQTLRARAGPMHVGRKRGFQCLGRMAPQSLGSCSLGSGPPSRSPAPRKAVHGGRTACRGRVSALSEGSGGRGEQGNTGNRGDAGRQ